MRASGLVGALLGGAIALLVGACDSESSLPDCGELPGASACPLAGGGTCADTSCSAVYSCGSDGKWSLEADCHRDGGYVANNDLDGGDEGGLGNEMCNQASSAPAYAACTALEAPECDAVIAMSCPSTACEIDCYTFLVCTPDGWADRVYGYCDDDGTLVVSSSDAGT